MGNSASKVDVCARQGAAVRWVFRVVGTVSPTQVEHPLRSRVAARALSPGPRNLDTNPCSNIISDQSIENDNQKIYDSIVGRSISSFLFVSPFMKES
ncbi:hypothetical protein EVAR_55702_1 [Eumeta japonica]|uniref:Uncharacterized protein n=1 Tax=Eumeta variegata TaxID=151549 RepID=A0A4C1ZF70_EUMVA|nr:hypothetical protein EVAR_55702_1 [Eumeta japonica]